MTTTDIRFFSAREDDSASRGHISATGKLLFSPQLLRQLGIDPAGARFRVGVPAGKGPVKVLYLVPTSELGDATFALQLGPRQAFIEVGRQLLSSGLDFKATRYRFTAVAADLNGQPGYVLTLLAQSSKRSASSAA